VEAPSEARESPETASADPDREPRSATGRAQTASERPWWRRVFGG
jgi:hypothetical protein